LNYHIQNHPTESKGEIPEADNQISMFDKAESELKNDLSELDVLNISPLDAIQQLDALKKKHGL
jgi:hypothetical protein